MIPCSDRATVMAEAIKLHPITAHPHPLIHPYKRFRVLHLMQCTNLGGMEQTACHLMRRLQTSGGFAVQVATRHGVNGVLLSYHGRQALTETILRLANSPRAPLVGPPPAIREDCSIAVTAARSKWWFERLCIDAPTERGQR